MNLLKKLWNFLFGKKEEEAIEEVDLNKIYDSEEPEETVQHCGTHLRFKKNCPDCLRAIGVM
tara:strand:+ start:461 stop:646 length:186 start_codon:yes stop_codon:yes gene_type:complete